MCTNQNSDVSSYADAHQEAKDCVTSGLANKCTGPVNASLSPPNSIARHVEDTQIRTDSEDGFNLELDVYWSLPR
jgi:hypothetical protein